MALVGACLVPSPARAGLILYAQEANTNGGAITQIATGADFTSASFTGTYGDFSLILDGAASTNAATLSSLVGATVSLKNNASDFRTINLYASQNNYTLPVGTPLNVESSLSGTVNIGSLTGSGVYTAFADNSNALLGTGFSNGAQNVVFSGSSFDTGSKTGTFIRTSANSLYSLTTQITANVSGGGEGNFSWHENVSAVPEPSTLASASIGAVMLGTYFWRRRQAKACA